MRLLTRLPLLQDFTEPLTISETCILGFLAQGMTQLEAAKRFENGTMRERLRKIRSKLPEYPYRVDSHILAIITYREGFIGPQGKFIEELSESEMVSMKEWIKHLKRGLSGSHTAAAQALDIPFGTFSHRLANVRAKVGDYSDNVPLAEQAGMIYRVTYGE